MRNFLFTAATCLGLAFGCAPLSPPQATVVTAASGDPTDAVTVTPTPALEAYRARRATTVDDPASYYRPWIAVLPFDGKSGFRDGVWDLRNEPARLLADEMERSVAWRVVPYAAVVEVVGAPPRRWEEQHVRQIIDALEADMVLTGDLLDYNMERMTVGDPLIGGYKAYKGIAELEVQLIRADNQRIGNAHSQQESLDRGVALDLLGKPREQDRQFAGLGQMEYGSKEFRSTAIGQATIAAMDEVMQQLAQLARPQGIQVSSGAAQILSVLGDELFVNVGSENGVHKGYRFAVYPSHQHVEGLDPDHRIAIVEVEDIIGARVSRVIALSGGGSIGVGDRLELIGIEP